MGVDVPGLTDENLSTLIIFLIEDPVMSEEVYLTGEPSVINN